VVWSSGSLKLEYIFHKNKIHHNVQNGPEVGPEVGGGVSHCPRRS
jgi:hypothetical protein